ncbi:MAG: GDP-mannose 4,6-dehydratase [Gammaproteobacteria bacterium]|nr:GDP-mannose 4,6-dehydratase [Gammaproteobacteria bacterium]
MTVLLTGYDGFVGSLFREEVPCVPLSDEYGKVDLRESTRLRAAIENIKPDFVMHLAAQSFVPESFFDPMTTYDINFTGTFNLLSALKNVGFQGKMLFVSSGDTYGLVSSECLPVGENHPLKPRSPYAVSKVAAEALCYQWSQTESFEVISARPFNHIGPRQSEEFVVSDFAKQIVEIKLGLRDPVLDVGDVGVTRDFTDVRDVIRAYALLLEKGQNGEAYNICSGKERTIHSLLLLMLKLAQVEASWQQDSSRFRLSEQRRIYGDFSKLRAHTGWSPVIPVEKTLLDTLGYWEKMLS